MSGFYLMHRGWQDQPLFGNDAFDRRSAFVWLIENANFADKDINVNGKTITVKRGQICASLRFMAKAWKWDLAKVCRFIKRAEVEKIIDTTTDTGQTIITICNYEKYQTPKREADTPSDTPARQQRDSSETKYKEGKEGKENTHYAFSGRTIKLTGRDLEGWRKRYSGVPDLEAALGAMDDWISDQPETERDKWFHIVSASLNKKHQAAVKPAADVEWEMPL